METTNFLQAGVRSQHEVEPALLDVQQVARMCCCSVRHIYRLADAGKMPCPLKLGALVRWPRAVIEDWIEQGCPHPRSGRKGGVR